MIWYCESCKAPCAEPTCPDCGRRALPPILPEDPCYLTQLQLPLAGILEDMLRRSAIPYSKRSTRGAGLSALLGSFGEWFCFYVPHEFLENAGDLVKALVSPCEEDDLTDL